MSRVVITGGAGFVGLRLARTFQQRGDDVVVLDLAPPAHWNGGFLRASVTDAEAVDQALQGVDWVFHEAGITSPTECNLDPRQAFAANVQGTFNVLEASQRRGVRRVIVASSSCLYGESNAPSEEDGARVVPGDTYSLTKHMVEEAVRFFARRGLNTVALRYFNTYGVGELGKKVGRSVITNLVVDVAEGRRPVLYGTGDQARDFVNVRDVVAANLLAMARGRAGEVYNVGSGSAITFRELLGIIQEEAGTHLEPEFAPIPHESYQQFTQADMRKSARELGFRPAVDLRHGVREILESLKAPPRGEGASGPAAGHARAYARE